MKLKHNWTTTKVRKSIYDKVSNCIKNEVDPTITNSSQFTDLALREKLERLKREST